MEPSRSHDTALAATSAGSSFGAGTGAGMGMGAGTGSGIGGSYSTPSIPGLAAHMGRGGTGTGSGSGSGSGSGAGSGGPSPPYDQPHSHPYASAGQLGGPAYGLAPLEPTRSLSPASAYGNGTGNGSGNNMGNSNIRPPTSAEIDAVIAAAIANAPPVPQQPEYDHDSMSRSKTPLMTNLLPAAVGADGRVNLFVGNLPYRVRWQDLKDLFRKAGTVLRADVSLGSDNRSRGYGTVLMGSREDAARAIDRYNGFTWQTRTLEVRPDRLPPEYEAQQHYPHLSHPHTHPHPQAPHPPPHYQLPYAHPHPLGNIGSSLPPFIAGSQTHPYPHPPSQAPGVGVGAWPSNAKRPPGTGSGGGTAGPGAGEGGSPHLHHPFPHPASVPGVPGSQAGLLGVAAAATGSIGGVGGMQGPQGFGSFGALGPPGPGPSGLTPHLTGTSTVAAPGPGGGPGARLSADRERERNSSSPFPVAASPLAGALTGAGAGSVPTALPVPAAGTGLEARRDSAVSVSRTTAAAGTSPYLPNPPPPSDINGVRKEGHSHSFSTASASGSITNPLLYPVQSRNRDNTSSTSPRFSTPPAPGSTSSEAGIGAGAGHAHAASTSGTGRAAPPGNLGPLPPNYFAALTSSGGKMAPSHTQGQAQAPGAAGMPAAPHFPVPIEGMAHQGVGLGPPENLHDRVVFVSNMPLSMQWQDLKDMLRPAGNIMRVDVAQDDNRRPRGYGTALFASEGDATRAVQMFNGSEIRGNKIRVHLERDAHVGGASQPESSASSSGGDETAESGDRQGTLSVRRGKTAAGTSPNRSKLPWGINTTLAQTPIRRTKISSSPNGTPYAQLPHSPTLFPGGPTPGPSFRSNAPPGPLTMPPFAMDPNTPAHASLNPLSPQMRGLPPMTPSMPGFVFNGAYPDTPGPHFFNQHGFGGFGSAMGMGMHMGMNMSMMPMGMMTPGPVIAPAPFSPGLPMSPMHPHTPNPFLNTAPGAPIDRILSQAQGQSHSNGSSRNVSGSSAAGAAAANGAGAQLRPTEGLRGSAALATPTTTVFAGRPTRREDEDENDNVAAETPGPIRAQAQANGNAGYFPYVPAETATPSRPRKVSGAQGQASQAAGGSREADDPDAVLGTLTENLNLKDKSAVAREAGLQDDEDEVKGRQSLDGARPRTVSISERRASFGDRR